MENVYDSVKRSTALVQDIQLASCFKWIFTECVKWQRCEFKFLIHHLFIIPWTPPHGYTTKNAYIYTIKVAAFKHLLSIKMSTLLKSSESRNVIYKHKIKIEKLTQLKSQKTFCFRWHWQHKIKQNKEKKKARAPIGEYRCHSFVFLSCLLLLLYIHKYSTKCVSFQPFLFTLERADQI